MKNLFILLLLINVMILASCASKVDDIKSEGEPETINTKINAGAFEEADELINRYICENDLSEKEVYKLSFKKELMRRIKLDFRQTPEEMLEHLKEYFPDVTKEQIKKWEKEKSLEVKIIDGQKRYFNYAVSNFLRINEKGKKRKEEIDGKTKDAETRYCEENIPLIVEALKNKNKTLGVPKTITVDYTLSVKPNAVPEGEIIRCWLPFPRKGNDRQTEIKLLSANSDNYIISDKSYLHSSLYMEKKAVKDSAVVFNIKFSYKAKAEWHRLKAEAVSRYDKTSEIYKKYTAERPPHVVFTRNIKELSDKIIGSESNTLNKVKKIYTWINDSIPWASAREYSTFQNIPEYVLENMHGDCGMQTLLFMTLARYNGIPVKWQSGWYFLPNTRSMHDWCEVYYEGIGWVPLDQSFKFIDSENEDVKNFYITGVEPHRMIVNDDFGREFFPVKIHHRSETIDFQRGEVEWRGGNLYFDKWTYKTVYKIN